ncbi:putative 7 alpha-cephem-methoxylase [Zopfia rhizophila CBS 207.26]|uniref:Putative 7 alpha-cephem-methoxylase n=1 Tax=Zopfia rhizophila CBS 207.26 TaxID=1314779 RepID=A0A6A6D7G6_9PEZI|nr:putative 7 alpha-cephem-methoxylase [Zopfia rhizophila CBS 207.26]
MSSPKDERVRLKYFKWKDLYEQEKPYILLMDVPDDFPSCNFEFEDGQLETIHDLRGRDVTFSLEDNAFKVVHFPTKQRNWDRASVQNDYFPEMEHLIRREISGVTDVFFFDWRLRSTDKAKTDTPEGSHVDLANPLHYLEPIEAVHVDQSDNGAYMRVEEHTGIRAAELHQRRFFIIKSVREHRLTLIDSRANDSFFSIWRPFGNTVENFPLAMCDGSTVGPRDLVLADHVRKTYIGETVYPLYQDNYKWYYLNRQTRDEVLILKMFDSEPTAKAKCCPHTSFKLSAGTDNPRARESIEIRALVFCEA